MACKDICEKRKHAKVVASNQPFFVSPIQRLENSREDLIFLNTFDLAFSQKQDIYNTICLSFNEAFECFYCLKKNSGQTQFACPIINLKKEMIKVVVKGVISQTRGENIAKATLSFIKKVREIQASSMAISGKECYLSEVIQLYQKEVNPFIKSTPWLRGLLFGIVGGAVGLVLGGVALLPILTGLVIAGGVGLFSSRAYKVDTKEMLTSVANICYF